MSTILEKITAQKIVEVAEQKKQISLNTLLKSPRTRANYSLKEHLLAPQSSGIIAEFKRKSPSKDWINKSANPEQIVTGYEMAGAAGLSILSDSHFFGGSLADITQVAPLVKLPILRKEFVVDEYQIVEAAKAGADVVLLIAACLSPQQVIHFGQVAQEHNLELLLEIHTTSELRHITEEVTLVGVNNRDLHTFTTTLETSVELGKFIPDRCVKISESGIATKLDIDYLRLFGFSGFLIGETFMRTDNPAKACKMFIDSCKHD